MIKVSKSASRFGKRSGVLAFVVVIAMVLAILIPSCAGPAPEQTVAPTTTTPPPATKNYTLTAQVILEVASPEFLLFADWGKRIEQRTNGRLKVTVQPGGALGYAGGELIKVTQQGLLDSHLSTGGWDYGAEPSFSVMELMGISKGLEADKKAADAILPDYKQIAETKWNQVILAHFLYGVDYIHGRKAVLKVDDFKGMKIRSWSPLMAESLQALGASPVVTPRAEIYTSLATGVIDANIADFVSIKGNKAYEVAKHVSMWKAAFAHAFFRVNKDWLNNLPKDIRDILLDETDNFLQPGLWDKNYYGDLDLIPFMVGQGVEIHYPTPVEEDEFRKIVSVSWETFKKQASGGEQLLQKALAAQQQ